jgi:hypothetical protein
MPVAEQKALIRKMPWGRFLLFVFISLLAVHLFLPQKYQVYTSLEKVYTAAKPALLKARLIGDNDDLTHPRQKKVIVPKDKKITDKVSTKQDKPGKKNTSPEPLTKPLNKATISKPSAGIAIFDEAEKLNKKEIQELELICKKARIEKKIIIEIHIETMNTAFTAIKWGQTNLSRLLKKIGGHTKALVICLTFQKKDEKRSIAIIRSGNLEQLLPDDELRSLENTYFLPAMRSALNPDYAKGLSSGLLALLKFFDKDLKDKK